MGYAQRGNSAPQAASHTMWQRLQERYGSQSAHGGDGSRVGTDAIALSKKRRAQMRMRADALAKSAADEEAPSTPHESGLVREEDEAGHGEEEYAEYTGATERIPLGREAERKRAVLRRQQIRSMIASTQGGDDDGDEDDIAIVVRQPRAQAPAPVSAETLIHDEQEVLPADRDGDDDDREAQDAWERAQMRRMNVDMGDPLEAPPVAARIPLVSAQPTPRSCMARLEVLRAQWEHEAVERNDAVRTMEQELGEVQEEERALQSEIVELEAKSAWLSDMNAFTDALASFFDTKTPLLEALEHNVQALLIDRYVTRRRLRTAADAWLSDADKEQFLEGCVQLRKEHALVMSDVENDAFRDPAVELVPRFEAWRTRYLGDYDKAWGGLALANAWEWYARYEIALWDPLWRAADDDLCLGGPVDGIPGFAWEHAMSAYVGESNAGGDNEMLATMLTRVVVPRLEALAQAYDAYSAMETTAALQVVEQVSYVVEKTPMRSLLSAYRDALDRAVREPVSDVSARLALVRHVLLWCTYYEDAWDHHAYENVARQAVTSAWSAVQQTPRMDDVVKAVREVCCVWPTSFLPSERQAYSVY